MRAPRLAHRSTIEVGEVGTEEKKIKDLSRALVASNKKQGN